MSDKRWEQVADNRHILYFTPYYEEEVIAAIWLDGDGYWWLESDLLGKDDEYLDENDVDVAKRDVEQLVLEHYEDKRNYYAELLEKWEAQQ